MSTSWSALIRASRCVSCSPSKRRASRTTALSSRYPDSTILRTSSSSSVGRLISISEAVTRMQKLVNPRRCSRIGRAHEHSGPDRDCGCAEEISRVCRPLPYRRSIESQHLMAPFGVHRAESPARNARRMSICGHHAGTRPGAESHSRWHGVFCYLPSPRSCEITKGRPSRMVRRLGAQVRIGLY